MVAARGQGSGASAQAHALDVFPPWQSGTVASRQELQALLATATGFGPEMSVAPSRVSRIRFEW
jgi:hypothetical protein